MACMTNILEHGVLNSVFNGVTLDPVDPAGATGPWVGLFEAAPSDTGGGTELSGNGYSRLTTSAADWNTPAGGSVDNVNALTFDAATANWNTIINFGIFDAHTSGNLLVWGTVSPSKTVQQDDVLVFPANSLNVNPD